MVGITLQNLHGNIISTHLVHYGLLADGTSLVIPKNEVRRAIRLVKSSKAPVLNQMYIELLRMVDDNNMDILTKWLMITIWIYNRTLQYYIQTW